MDALIILILCAFRLLSVFAVQTFFSPDEYWQSLEVAHKMIFGFVLCLVSGSIKINFSDSRYGHETWEWKQGIRSYLYPAIISGVYKVLAVLGVDSVSVLIFAPRILQALISAYSDYRFYKWCNKSKWSLFIIMTSWFWFYTGSRTLINSLEASLITIIFSFFPWGKSGKNRQSQQCNLVGLKLIFLNDSESTGFLWISILLAYIRPTSVITLLPLWLHHITKSRYSIGELFWKRYAFLGILICAMMITLDSYFHGSTIAVPYEFFKANILNNVSGFYGTHPFYWYFTSGLPAILGVNLIPLSFAILDFFRNFSASKSRQTIFASIFLTVLIYSLIPHKEFRFLLQILPLCLYIISKYLSEWSRKQSEMTIWFAALVILVSNAVPAGYLGYVHQQGTVKVMDTVADIAKNYKAESGLAPKIFFMMPCHSTPYYSHVHANITMRFLKCEPNLNNKADYVDEADKFYDSPMKWIRTHLPVHPIEALPTHIVIFDSLAPKISDFLSIYQPKHVHFHADFLSHARGGKNVIIFERMNVANKNKEKNPSGEALKKESGTKQEL